MGHAQSAVDQRHVGIYNKLQAIQDSQTKLRMIDTLLSDPALVHSAKIAGIYSTILQTAAAIRHGQPPPPLPKQMPAQMPARMPASIQHFPQAMQVQSSSSIISHQTNQTSPYAQLNKPKRSEKALNFFTACLRVLNIQEEVALTEDGLKQAYKKAAIRAHPDKGGSEDAFDAVTRAYAYLSDILQLIKGRQLTQSNTPTPGLEAVQRQRSDASNDWKMPAEPVKLNPNNLDINKFNSLFEQTRIPDPDEDGYGDWLKDESGGSRSGKKGAKKFSGEFNRDVFNRMFEDEQRQNHETGLINFQHPQELVMAPNMGIELGRGKPSEYTAAPGSDLQFTDLRAAYTTHNTVSNQIKGVQVHERDYNSVKAQRERAPDVYNASEMAALQAFEAQQKAKEEQRQLRAAQEQMNASDYFKRMRQLVITEK